MALRDGMTEGCRDRWPGEISQMPGRSELPGIAR
jgi:hypothetical protein